MVTSMNHKTNTVAESICNYICWYFMQTFVGVFFQAPVKFPIDDILIHITHGANTSTIR